MKRVAKENIQIGKHISGFLNDYVPSQKTNSQNTLKSYRYALILYMTFLESVKKVCSSDLKGECFEYKNIEEWLAWLKDVRECSPDTCNNRLASLRVFLKYLGSRDISYLYLYQEASTIPRRKSTRRNIKGMSRQAVKSLLATPDISTKTGRRDMAFMILLYSTAARLDEILSMKNKQIHLTGDKPYATIIGKGNKIRTLYLLPRTVAHLQRYRQEFHGEVPAPEGFLFYSRNVGVYGKLTQSAIDKMLKKRAASIVEICDEVPVKLHAHQFRHAKASHWLEDGMNIVQISFLLGHEHLQTTMVYLDITTEEKARALATLEEENDKKVSRKWKDSTGSLIDFCGLKNR